jgi:hypothetical protein
MRVSKRRNGESGRQQAEGVRSGVAGRLIGHAVLPEGFSNGRIIRAAGDIVDDLKES